MSVVFGGKLISQKGQVAVDDYDDPNYGIKLLSKREKALLAELDRTRSEIVSELVTLGSSVSAGDLEDWHNTIHAYESQINEIGPSISIQSSNHRRTKKAHYRTQPQRVSSGKLKALKSSTFHCDSTSKTMTGLDFLPALSIAGVRGSNKRKNGPSQSVRLPILTLPSLRTNSSLFNSHCGSAEDSPRPPDPPLPDLTEELGGPPASSPSALRLDGLDRYYIQQYLEISNEQMDEILQDLDAILMGATAAGNCDDNSHQSVFNAARDAAFDGRRGWWDSAPPVASQLSASRETKSKEKLSHLSSSGFSRSSSLRKNKMIDVHTTGTRRVANNNKESTRKSKTVKVAWSEGGSGINDLNSLDALRTELVKSLGNMQHHTAEVNKEDAVCIVISRV
jgi:hypothetical protein